MNNSPKPVVGVQTKKGFMSPNWKCWQELLEIQSPSKYSSEQWEVEFILNLQMNTYEVWNKQNKILHGDSKRECNDKMKQKLRLQIKDLYSIDWTDIDPGDIRLFKMPYTQHQKGRIGGMRTWITMAEMAFQKVPNLQTELMEFPFFPKLAEWKINNGIIMQSDSLD